MSTRTKQRLAELEKDAGKPGEGDAPAIRVLIQDADGETVTDSHTGETWPGADKAPDDSALTLLIRK